jgi:thioesterase domain-containing protein
VQPSERRFVVFNQSGRKRPVVFIEAWPEERDYVTALAESLGADQPVYATGLPTLEECDELRTLDGYLKMLTRALDSLPVDPPYVLFGWSLGGILAFELAARLGPQVGTVIVLDSMFVRWGHWRSRPTWYRAKRAATKGSGERLIRFVCSSVWGEARTVVRRLKTEARVERDHWHRVKEGGARSLLGEINWASQNMLKEHYVRPISTPIIMVTLTDSIARVGFDPGDAWQSALGGNVARVRIDGGHYTIWKPESIGQLGEVVSNATSL